MIGKLPTLMVSSTFYDLRETRQALSQFIEDELGYHVLISESPRFPIDPSAGTIDNCKSRVEQNADVLLLVVGERYGFVEPISGKSVTNLEYLAARAKGIPIFAFIDRQTLTLYEDWRQRSVDDNSAEADESDRTRLFRFINQIRSIDSVWTNTFDHSADIAAGLRVQLAYQLYDALQIKRRVNLTSEARFLSRLSGNTFRLALEKPSAWEFRLFASALSDEVEAAHEQRRDYDLGLALGELVYIKQDEFLRWMQIRLGEYQQLVEAANKLVNESLQSALGPIGEPGNAVDIVFVASRLGAVYRNAMDWTRRVRLSYPGADEFGAIVDALSALSVETVSKLGEWGPHLTSEIQRTMEEAAAAPAGSEPKRVMLTLTLTGAGINEVWEMTKKVYAVRGVHV